MTLVEFVNLTLSFLAVASHGFLIVAIIFLVFWRGKYDSIFNFLAKRGLFFAFLIALISALGSLFYSEVAGYAPCTLCWYQRIFMYPQVILLGIALFKRDKGIIDYSLVLSLIGAAIAGYHYLLQLGLVSGFPCSAVGYSVSCSKIFVMRFGYVTLPLMAFTAFLMIIAFLLFAKIKAKSNGKL